MKLGFNIGYTGRTFSLPVELVQRAEAMGFDSVWTAEAYGSDAVTTATWLLAHTKKIRVGTAIMQMPARTPAMAAMTSMSLHHLSGGRFVIGLGASGPQVVEGWHGVPYGKPVTRTKEYIRIMRQIMERRAPLEFQGEVYQVPNTGPGTTGLGKPLKSILEPCPDIPIYTASVTPRGLRCAGEVADGVFPVWMDPNRFDVVGEYLQEGFERAGGGKSLDDFDVAPTVFAVLNDDVDVALDSLRPTLALYIGGMGASGKNFYNDYASRMGYAEEAAQIQELYLQGHKAAAEALVPDAFIDAVALVGPRERIIERLTPWKEAGKRGEVGSMILATTETEVMEIIAGELL